MLLSEYKNALMLKTFWNPCKEALEECREYIHRITGKIEHSRCAGTVDPTSTGENHGDMVIADALCLRGIRDRGGSQEENKEAKELAACPPGSYLYRRREYERSLIKNTRY